MGTGWVNKRSLPTGSKTWAKGESNKLRRPQSVELKEIYVKKRPQQTKGRI